MPKITVIGSLNMDLIITSARIPNLGETILGQNFMTAPGGKGANQAVAAARLGGDVTMIGCIGDDIFGSNLIDNLNSNGVNTKYINVTKDYPTGVAIILIKDGDNCIIVDQGANQNLLPENIQKMEDVIRDSNIVVIQLEIPLETMKMAINIAKKYNVKVLLNPAPAIKLSDNLLSMVDILTPNESECEIITGKPVKSIEDAKSAVAYLVGKGIETVAVTLGDKGVVYNSKDKIIHKPVQKVKVVDTTAAGDSFTGALAVAISKGEDINTAIDMANVVGTLTVTKKGAQTSLPSLSEVKDLMNTMRVDNHTTHAI